MVNVWEIAAYYLIYNERRQEVIREISFSTVVSELNQKDGYRQLNVRLLGSLCPWDHRGKCYMDRKRIQCLLNASQARSM